MDQSLFTVPSLPILQARFQHLSGELAELRSFWIVFATLADKDATAAGLARDLFVRFHSHLTVYLPPNLKPREEQRLGKLLAQNEVVGIFLPDDGDFDDRVTRVASYLSSLVEY